MTIVTLRIKVPPDLQKDFLDASRMFVGPTQVQPGCTSCRIYQDADDPDTFLLLEQWKTRKELDHHLKSDRYRILLSLIDMSINRPEFQLGTISKIEGLDSIKAIRETA